MPEATTFHTPWLSVYQFAAVQLYSTIYAYLCIFASLLA